MNILIGFEIAKLLKEKGFNEEVRDYYETKDGTFYHSQYFRDNISINEKHKGFVTAPTVAEVIMWLYEKHGIWISVIHQHNKFFWKFGSYQTQEFNSPMEAYEAAIDYVLNNLI